MEADIQERMRALEAKIDAVFVSVEKSRRYLLVMAWVSIAAVALPLVALVFIIPMVLSALGSVYSGVL